MQTEGVDLTPARGGPITPAIWAAAASHGEWECRDFHALIDRALMRMVSARVRGEAHHLLIMAPPQHGKTTLVAHALPCVWFGYFPEDRIILASYEAETAEKRGRAARNEFAEYAPGMFDLGVDPRVNADSDWKVQGHRAEMISRGVGGAISGAPCELLIIDDPIKGPKDVAAKSFRDDQWDWYETVAKKRLRKKSSSVLIYTAWHSDDLGQRMIRASVKGEIAPIEVIRLPGVSETQQDRDEWARDLGLPVGQDDPLGRPPGVPLWDDVYSLAEHLRDRRRNPVHFYSVNQGRPIAPGGNKFQGEWVRDRLVRPGHLPADLQFCRAWDKAASTKKKSDYTASTLMARDPRGRYYVFSSRSFKLSPNERDLLIVGTAEADQARHGSVHIYGQIDPGQAGLGDEETFRRQLDRFWVTVERPRGSKEYRFMPFCSAAQGGNVFIVSEADGSPPDWLEPWIRQLQAFPKGAHDDEVDTTSDAYSVLAGQGNACEASPESPIDDYDGEVQPAVYPLTRSA